MNPTGDAVSWVAALLQTPILVTWLLLTAYVLFLTVSAFVARLQERKQAPSRLANTRFSVLVPAHNEALVIEQCLISLNSLDYPVGMRRVIVIADNCTDNTAAIAESRGAIVYQRHDEVKRSKGYALDWALQRLLADDGGWTNAIVVFDADTIADPQFLRHMDARLSMGSLALQGQYNLLNPFDNWRTGLLYAALLLHNRLRPLARRALGWTTLLKGNGMCFARSVVERFGWNAYGLAEDIEYTTMLLDAGIKVDPVPEATLYAQAPQTRTQSDSQRMRWEGGRFALARRDGLRLFRDFLRTGSATRLDWAMDLLTPPMAILVGIPLLFGGLNVGLFLLLGAPIAATVAMTWAALFLGTCVHVVGGLVISGADPRSYLYLLATPLFLIWKLQVYATMLRKRGPQGWVRTERTIIP